MTETEIANLAISHIGGRPLSVLATDITTQAISCRKWFDAARDECLGAHPWNFAMKRHRAETVYLSLGASGVSDSGGLFLLNYTAHGLVTGDRVDISEVEGTPNANGQWIITRIDDDFFTLDDSVFAGTYTASTGKFVKIPVFGLSRQFTLPSDFIAVRKVNGLEGNEEDSVPYSIEGGLLLMDENLLEMTYTFREEMTTNWPQTFINAFSFLLASYIAQDLTGPAGQALQMREYYEKVFLSKAMGRDSRQGKGRSLDPDYDSPTVLARRGLRSPFSIR